MMELTKKEIAWLLKRLSNKDGAEFMAHISSGSPLSTEPPLLIHVDYDKHETTIYRGDEIVGKC